MSKKDKKTIFSNSLADYSAALRQHPASPVFEQMPLALSQKHTLISQNWNLLSWSFTNSGLIQRFIMQPILDGLRGGLTITSKQLDDEEIKHLNKMYEVKAREPIRNTMIWNKLYGGAGIIINAGEEYKTPLDIADIPQGADIEFYDADLWELDYKFSAFNINQIQESENEDWNGGVWYNYYGIPIHKTRVLRVEGRRAPALLRRNLRGWGMSELEFVLPQINMYEKLEREIF